MARSATTSRHGRRAANHEHHSVFEERSVLDALWSAVVAAPTSVMPPASPDALDLADDPTPAPPLAPETLMPEEVAPEGFAPEDVGPTEPDPEDLAPEAPGTPVAFETPVVSETPAAVEVPGAAQVPGPAVVDEPPARVRATTPEPFEPVLGRPTVPTAAPEAPAARPAAADAAGEDAVAAAGEQAAPRHPAAPPPRVTGPFDLSYAAPPSTNRTIWAGPRHAAPLDWSSASALLTVETPAAVADAGLLVMRLVIGLTMAAHGAQKAFGMFGGEGFGATADGFSALGYQPGAMFALAAIVGELFGGLFLALGLLTPLAAGGIIGVTVNAMVAVNLGNGFFASHDGIELPLILSGAALGVMLAGPGRYAVDARIPFFNGAAVQCVAAGVALLAMLTSLGAHLL